MRRLYADILGPYWSPQIRHVEDGYRSLPFPFEAVTTTPFLLAQNWDIDRLAAYMGTWSASQRYHTETGGDPIEPIRGELAAAWGDPSRVREVAWDLSLRVGRIHP